MGNHLHLLLQRRDPRRLSPMIAGLRENVLGEDPHEAGVGREQGAIGDQELARIRLTRSINGSTA